MRIYFLVFLATISYLVSAQKFEFTEPIRLSNQINSKAEDICPILAPDGKTLYFAKVLDPANSGGDLGGMDIWMSTKDKDGMWLPSSNKLNNWNNKYNNAVIGVSENGAVVYLLNAYERGGGIAFSKFHSGEWSKPERISIPGIDQNDIVGCYMDPSFNVLLLSLNGKKSFGQEDLFICLKDSLESWGVPINLGSTINTEAYEISPFLSKDRKHIYFSSNRHAGYGEADIFTSERLYDSWTVWTKPLNLGKGINSEKFDAYFSLSNDSICYFSSNRDGDLSDIYQSKIIVQQKTLVKDSIDKIVQQTQLLLSGLALNEKNPKKQVIEIIVFELGKTNLSTKAKQQISSKILPLYNSEFVDNIEICGYYFDSKVSDEHLVFERVKIVNEYMISLGISQKKLVTLTIQEKIGSSLKTSLIEIRINPY